MIYKSILLILGYLYGTMLTATFVVKHSTGNDVSKIGSGNPGMANVMEHIGKKEGVLVLAGDILKVIVAGILGGQPEHLQAEGLPAVRHHGPGLPGPRRRHLPQPHHAGKSVPGG